MPWIDLTPLYGYHFRREERVGEHLAKVRRAIRQSRKLSLGYADGRRAGSARVVRPLALSFVGHTWLLTAWCELRVAFRNFRLARITSRDPSADSFVPEAGKRWED